MGDRRFDNFIRALHDSTGSRRALPAFLAGLSLPAFVSSDAVEARDAKKRKRRQRRSAKRKRQQKHLDPGVRFFELLAAEMQQVSGDCAALTQAAANFQQEHQAEFAALQSREQQWDAATRAQVAARYQDRISRATESLHTLMTACRFRGGTETTICAPNGAPGGDPGPRPGAVQCSAGCDCSCICPISGWDCAGSFFGCMGGSHASCCWFGACAGHICAEQCPNCCNCQEDCCGC